VGHVEKSDDSVAPPRARITSLKVGGVGGDYILLREKGEGGGGGAVGGREVDEGGSERVFSTTTILDLCNIYNIAHIKSTKSSNLFLLENNNYLLKSCTFNIKCSSFNTNLLF
jgi:hypothetical protein